MHEQVVAVMQRSGSLVPASSAERCQSIHDAAPYINALVGRSQWPPAVNTDLQQSLSPRSPLLPSRFITRSTRTKPRRHPSTEQRH